MVRQPGGGVGRRAVQRAEFCCALTLEPLEGGVSSRLACLWIERPARLAPEPLLVAVVLQDVGQVEVAVDGVQTLGVGRIRLDRPVLVLMPCGWR